MRRFDDLKIRQLDEVLSSFREAADRPPPRDGWARAIRTALGMSLRQLAQRAGLSKTAVHSVERNEVSGTVQLESLRNLADAMDCQLVYALVPRAGSLRRVLERQAERVAEQLVGRVSDSMDLEAQSIGADERARQVTELKAELLRDRRRDFWDV